MAPTSGILSRPALFGRWTLARPWKVGHRPFEIASTGRRPGRRRDGGGAPQMGDGAASCPETSSKFWQANLRSHPSVWGVLPTAGTDGEPWA